MRQSRIAAARNPRRWNCDGNSEGQTSDDPAYFIKDSISR